MEKPDIAVPPHTQRRIADYLLHNTTQAFATSHSPYVIERFEPEQTLLLSRGPDFSVTAKKVSDAGGLKGNDFKRFARRGLTECMLGKGAIVVEGLTEFHALRVAARKLEESDTSLQPLDIAGAAFFDAESEGSMPKFGTFFKALGLKTFSFYDSMPRPPEKKKLFADAFDLDCEHAHTGFEVLIVSEMSLDRPWSFLEDLRASGDNGNLTIPSARPTDAELRKLARSALESSKGAGWAARLFEGSTVAPPGRGWQPSTPQPHHTSYGAVLQLARFHGVISASTPRSPWRRSNFQPLRLQRILSTAACLTATVI